MRVAFVSDVHANLPALERMGPATANVTAERLGIF